nr:hypothetical protein [Treponema denticola]
MGRLIFILLLSVSGLIFLAVIFGMYIYMKRTVSGGKSLMEEPVNKQTDTTKMRFSEFLVYASVILGAVLFALQVIKKGGSGFSNLATAIILPPVMALFNARKRTGRSIFIFMAVAIFSLYMFLVYIIISVPVKAPVFTINNTKIKMAHTTVADIVADGFDIYVKQDNPSGRDYKKLLSCGAFKKYPVDRSILVEKGFRRNNTAIPYADYLLVKDGFVIGSIGLYGHKKKDTVLEDCKIIHLKLDEYCLSDARENSIRYWLDDVELLVPLQRETLQKTFDKKLWLVPPKNTRDITQLHYGIKWSTGSDHLFWNEYFAYIHFNESNDMTGFEISTEIARDWNE